MELDKETAELVIRAARKARTSNSAFLRKLILGGATGKEVEPGPPGLERAKTLVAVVRVPERVAQGLRCGSESLARWCGDWLGEGWGAEFDGEEWEGEVRARFGCEPGDKYDFDGLDAGFVEAGSEAEKTIMGLLTERADADTSAE